MTCNPVFITKPSLAGGELHIVHCTCDHPKHQGVVWYSTQYRALKSWEHRVATVTA